MTAAGTTSGSLIGRVFHGRFRIEKLIGRGGMGAVYQAQQLGLDKPVALKVLAKHLAEEERQIERFKQEAFNSSKLRHPNTIRVLDYGQSEDGYLYLAMELLEGLELSKILREGALEPRRAVKVARQICKAIGEAHAHGLVHRDLKPDNIFLCDFFGEKDFVKVLDFGIAKFMEDTPGQESLTQTGFICGTPLYIAPEQALGKQVTARTDLYSCGVLLYEMLTGSPPFRADTPIAIVMRHIHDTPPDLRHFKPDLDIPVELEQLCFQLLEKDARQRPSSAEEVGLALEDLLSSGVLGRPRTSPKLAMPQEPEATRVLTAAQIAMLDSESEMPAPPAAAQAAHAHGMEPAAPHNAQPPPGGAFNAERTMMLDPSSSASDLPLPSARPAQTGAMPTSGPGMMAASAPRAGGSRRWMWLVALLVLVGGAAAAFALTSGGSPGPAPPTAKNNPAVGPGSKAGKKPTPQPPTTVVVSETADASTSAAGEADAKAAVGPDVGEGSEPAAGPDATAPVAADAGEVARVAAQPDASGTTDTGSEAVAAADAAAPPEMVKIDCVPTDCTVHDGSENLGKAPLQVELEPARKLKVRLSGYRTETVRIDPEAVRASGQPWITVELKKRKKGGGKGGKWNKWKPI